MKNIDIQFIPHEEQRYNTIGDWWVDERGALHIRVTSLPHVGSMVAIAAHELVEWWLCQLAGITQTEVDAFDIEWEKHNDLEGEPGDDPAAPYHTQHCFATAVERIVVAASGINWTEHEQEMLIAMHARQHSN